MGGYSRRRGLRKSYRRASRRKRYGRKKKQGKFYDRPSILTYKGGPLGTLLPDKFMTTMVATAYVENIPATPAEQFLFNLNSIFDPFGAHSAVQPYGRDQLVLLYNNYRVWASKLVVYPQNDNNTGICYAVYPTLSTTTPASIALAMQFPYSKWRCQGAAGSPQTHIKHYMSVKKMFGLNLTISDDNYSAAMGANPVGLCYWSLLFASTQVAVDLFYTYAISITYYVELYNRVTQGIS